MIYYHETLLNFVSRFSGKCFKKGVRKSLKFVFIANNGKTIKTHGFYNDVYLLLSMLKVRPLKGIQYF